MCLDAKSTPKKLLKRRHALLGDLDLLVKAAGEATVEINTTQVERLPIAVGRTYQNPARKVPRIALWSKYLLLARVYAAQQDPMKCLTMALKTLESLSFVIEGANILDSSARPLLVLHWVIMTDGVIEAWVHLWNVYAAFKPQLAEKAGAYARIAYRICIGEDVTFDETCGEKPVASTTS